MTIREILRQKDFPLSIRIAYFFMLLSGVLAIFFAIAYSLNGEGMAKSLLIAFCVTSYVALFFSIYSALVRRHVIVFSDFDFEIHKKDDGVFMYWLFVALEIALMMVPLVFVRN